MNVTWWKIHHEWRCISSWKLVFFFQRSSCVSEPMGCITSRAQRCSFKFEKNRGIQLQLSGSCNFYSYDLDENGHLESYFHLKSGRSGHLQYTYLANGWTLDFFGITYLAGKISRSNLFFQGPGRLSEYMIENVISAYTKILTVNIHHIASPETHTFDQVLWEPCEQWKTTWLFRVYRESYPILWGYWDPH